MEAFSSEKEKWTSSSRNLLSSSRFLSRNSDIAEEASSHAGDDDDWNDVVLLK
jgi:hypothetical protein